MKNEKWKKKKTIQKSPYIPIENVIKLQKLDEALCLNPEEVEREQLTGPTRRTLTKSEKEKIKAQIRQDEPTILSPVTPASASEDIAEYSLKAMKLVARKIAQSKSTVVPGLTLSMGEAERLEKLRQLQEKYLERQESLMKEFSTLVEHMKVSSGAGMAIEDQMIAK